MIVTELYNGQGFGNQLWCYVVTRCVAKENNLEFGIQSKHKFKGVEFMGLDFGKEVVGGHGIEGGPPAQLPNGIEFYYKEKLTRTSYGLDISEKDSNLFKIRDKTKIDGIMQSIKYIEKYREEIKVWLKINEDKNIKKYSDKNICIIHIRGGDFHGSSAILYKEYYENCINEMKKKNKNMRFYIITDDINFSKNMFPNIEIIGGVINGEDSHKANFHYGGPIWMDYSILLNSKNTILSASSFSFWPTWLNDDVFVIAPKYWAAHKINDGNWSCGDSLINNWFYMDKNGVLNTYEKCLIEKYGE